MSHTVYSRLVVRPQPNLDAQFCIHLRSENKNNPIPTFLGLYIEESRILSFLSSYFSHLFCFALFHCLFTCHALMRKTRPPVRQTDGGTNRHKMSNFACFLFVWLTSLWLIWGIFWKEVDPEVSSMLKLMCTVDAKLRGQRSRACLRKWCSPRSRTALMYCYNNNTLASVSFSASLSCHSHFNTFFFPFCQTDTSNPPIYTHSNREATA